MPNIFIYVLQNPLIFIFGISTIIFSVLYLSERDNKKEVAKKNRELYDQIESQSSTILREALTKSQNILQQAAIDQSQLLENSRANIGRIEQVYQNFVAELKARNEQEQTDIEEMIKNKTTTSLEKVEQNLADFLNKTQEQSIGSIQLEIQAARQLVDTYKRRQIASIDENILAILERTMGQVLSKRLSLKDHVDMVYDALEKAKLERFIV
jgi:hypothetical protein